MGMDYDQVIRSWRPTKRSWPQLVWMINVWVPAATAVLVLELSGVHPTGMLMRLWLRIAMF